MLSTVTLSGMWLVARCLEKGVHAEVGVPVSLYRFCVQLLANRCLSEMEMRDLVLHHSVLLEIFKDEAGNGKRAGLSVKHTARRAMLAEAVENGGPLVLKFQPDSASGSPRQYEGSARSVQWIPDMLTPEILENMLSRAFVGVDSLDRPRPRPVLLEARGHPVCCRARAFA